jgi:hypothetical protein
MPDRISDPILAAAKRRADSIREDRELLETQIRKSQDTIARSRELIARLDDLLAKIDSKS